MTATAMSGTRRVEDYLTSHRVAHQLHRHRSAAFTAAEVGHLEAVPETMVAKPVLVWAGGRLLMFVVPASSWVDLAKAAQALGVPQVTLAHEDEIAARFPDCKPGATPPFGNLYGVPVYVDRTLGDNRTVFFLAGTHQDVVEAGFSDLVRLADAAVVDVALREAA